MMNAVTNFFRFRSDYAQQRAKSLSLRKKPQATVPTRYAMDSFARYLRKPFFYNKPYMFDEVIFSLQGAEYGGNMFGYGSKSVLGTGKEQQ